MKVFMACLILGSLFGLIPPSLPAQQNQSPQYSAQEFEALKIQVSELEKKLQTVENTEKMELQAKLAEANAKLADANAKLVNVEFDKFKRGLQDYNDDWLKGWGTWFVGVLGLLVLIIGGVGAAFWFWLKSTTNQLIADRVEMSLNGFKEGLEEVGTLKNEIGVLKDQQRVLEREHTTATLEVFFNDSLWYQEDHPEQIKGLREEALLDVFGDKGRVQTIRYKAAGILFARKSPRLVSPVLEHLNSIVDSDADLDVVTEHILRRLTNYLGDIHTKETYEGLTKFLNRLLTENPQHKQLLLAETTFSLAKVSLKLNLVNSVSMLKRAIPQLDVGHHNQLVLMNLPWQFDKFNEPEGIKEILDYHGKSLPSEEIDKCLELLQKHDPEFVKKWRAENTTDDTDSA